MSSIRPRDQSPVGLKWAHSVALHVLEVKSKHISGVLLGGLYGNCLRALLSASSSSPGSPDWRSDLPELISGAGSSTKPVLWPQETLHEDLATAGVAVCTEKGILPRVCGLKQTHVTKPQIFAFNDTLDCKPNVAM